MVNVIMLSVVAQYSCHSCTTFTIVNFYFVHKARAFDAWKHLLLRYIFEGWNLP
jgi:hypothetical protein